MNVPSVNVNKVCLSGLNTIYQADLMISSGEYDIVEGLRFRTTFGADNADRWRYTYYPRTTLRGEQARGEAIRAVSNTTSWLNENTLTYQREFGGIHDLNVLGASSRRAR